MLGALETLGLALGSGSKSMIRLERDQLPWTWRLLAKYSYYVPKTGGSTYLADSKMISYLKPSDTVTRQCIGGTGITPGRDQC
jgi:hypothetical protein